MKHKAVTVEQVMEWGPCGEYTEERVRKLFKGRRRVTALDVLPMWIPLDDRFWVVLREDMIDARTLRLFACDCAERALQRERKHGREPDRRSWDAVAVSRRYAMGKATNRELTAARAAARNAARYAAWAASDAAWYAARDGASDAARDGASDATWYAARDGAGAAEREWQVRHLVEMLETQ